MNFANRLAVGAALAAMAGTIGASTLPVDDGSIKFDVYLDDSKIGFHRFYFDDLDSGARVESNAEFDVKFLFVTAFKYRHTAEERWTNGCLERLDAETNANGKELAVVGERTEGGFVVRQGGEAEQLPECVMTFAYWNPAFLEQPKLLNPQTGEYLDVQVQRLEPADISVSGRTVRATPYRLEAKGMDLTVWYSPDREWLALESVAKGGRIIRYERSRA